jgi:hypothetical protein
MQAYNRAHAFNLAMQQERHSDFVVYDEEEPESDEEFNKPEGYKLSSLEERERIVNRAAKKFEKAEEDMEKDWWKSKVLLREKDEDIMDEEIANSEDEETELGADKKRFKSECDWQEDPMGCLAQEASESEGEEEGEVRDLEQEEPEQEDQGIEVGDDSNISTNPDLNNSDAPVGNPITPVQTSILEYTSRQGFDEDISFALPKYEFPTFSPKYKDEKSRKRKERLDSLQQNKKLKKEMKREIELKKFKEEDSEGKIRVSKVKKEFSGQDEQGQVIP